MDRHLFLAVQLDHGVRQFVVCWLPASTAYDGKGGIWPKAANSIVGAALALGITLPMPGIVVATNFTAVAVQR